MTQNINAENLQEAKPQEFSDSEQNHYEERYYNMRLKGNDLELYLRQPAVITYTYFVSNSLTPYVQQ